MDKQNDVRVGQNQLISFLWIRRGIGLLGIVFPLILVVGARIFGECTKIQSSISDYYHTSMRDVFVGILWMIAIFLFTYRGPEKKDNVLTNIAALFAVGISLFPTSINDLASNCLVCGNVYTQKTIHNILAASFFLVITYISYYLFPKTSPNSPPTPQKLERNKIYKMMAIIMLVSIIIILDFNLLYDLLPTNLKNLPITFIFEWVALWAFGTAWIVKGEWFLEDQN